MIISTLMNKIINLEKIVSCDVAMLRMLYDKIENNVRALGSVGVDKEQFGALLIPIILGKLPNIIRLEISRKLGKENWNVDDFIKCIKNSLN